MRLSYSIYEAKAKLSEITRHVKRKRRVTITERGREVARVVPIEDGASLEDRIEELAAQGVLSVAPAAKPQTLRAVARRRGALRRFLDERES